MTRYPGSSRNPLVRIAVSVIRVYQYCLSPLVGPCCRHLPTCSEYAEEAIRRHGLSRGGWLALRRLGRCHPWGSSGYDPVPD
ncbi:MAG: membrane protein insertion efficiency factor YidD [Arenicellales bacterium]